MDLATKHSLLVSEVIVLQGMLSNAGYEEIGPTEKSVLDKWSNEDLSTLVRSLRDLARTPH